jgi:hypothetical protein
MLTFTAVLVFGGVGVTRIDVMNARYDASAATAQDPVYDPQAGVEQNPAVAHVHVHTEPAGTIVAGPLDPSVGGQWQYLRPLPSKTKNPVHSITGPNGKVLEVTGSGGDKRLLAAGTFSSRLYDPVTDTYTNVATPTDMFCAGQTLLPDGRALVGGGTAAINGGPSPAPYTFKGSMSLYAFDFTTLTYQKLTPLEVGRWYPSIVNWFDGAVFIIGGLDGTGVTTDVNEVFHYPTDTHTTLPGHRAFALYPQLHPAMNGQLFYAYNDPGFWAPYTNKFTPVPGLKSLARTGSSSCFVGDVRDQNLILMGGGWPANKVVAEINLKASNPTFTLGPPLPSAKAYLNCVNLPNGQTLEVGGCSNNLATAAKHDVAILNSVDGPWVAMNPLPAGEHRCYHSNEFVDDNGDVMSYTSNPTDAPFSLSVLRWSPPYQFLGTRPTLAVPTTDMKYDATYTMTTTGGADRISVLTWSDPTHATQPNQRYLSLPLSGSGAITLPTRASRVLTPGWYRLWAVNPAGALSKAVWIHLS